MPKLNEVEINFDQVRRLVKQLDFENKMALIKDITRESDYKNNFYAYTENLTRRYNIPPMTETELDDFLHQEH